MRAARIFLAAAAAVVAGLGPGHSAQADSTCPTATFLSFDHVAYISKAIPAGVEIPVGTGLGSGSLDQPASPDGCKRERDSVQVLTAGSLEPGVAVLVQGRLVDRADLSFRFSVRGAPAVVRKRRQLIPSRSTRTAAQSASAPRPDR